MICQHAGESLCALSAALPTSQRLGGRRGVVSQPIIRNTLYDVIGPTHVVGLMQQVAGENCTVTDRG